MFSLNLIKFSLKLRNILFIKNLSVDQAYKVIYKRSFLSDANAALLCGALANGPNTTLKSCFSTNTFHVRFNHTDDTIKKSLDTFVVKPFILPDIGEGINEVVIREWLVKEGDNVKEFDPICEVESDKATATITSRFDGVISKVHHDIGAKAKVGSSLVDITMVTSTSNSNSSPQGNESRPLIEPEAREDSNISMSNKHRPMLPSVRRLAHQLNVDISKVKATGKSGRILKEDIEEHLRSAENKSSSDEVLSNDSNSQSKTTGDRLISVLKLNSVKKAMFKTMTKSLDIPHFNYSEEIDMTRLINSIKRSNELLNDQKDRISNLAVIIKMLSLALSQFPEMNASLTGVEKPGEELLIKHFHNIGVAIDSPAGLVVPNIKNVENLTFEGVNLELSRLRRLSYNSKLGLDDLTGGTITVSNIGAIGGTFGVPVILSPEIVIVALGRIRNLPRYDNKGNLEPRRILQAVWSADHRCVDGAALSRLSNLLKFYLENPDAVMLKLK